jgi:glycosyltransferase involved in cell wall biosynthesis
VIERIAVVVPARNEELLLPACLDALAAAIEMVDVAVDVVVALDRCQDGSAEVVAERPWVAAVEIDAGNVGRARRAATQLALRVPQVPPERHWLATTDADSVVPSDWLAGQLALAADGWEVVVGTVQVEDWSAHPDGVAGRWAARYRGVDHHHHVHGANLGLTAAAYLDAGGWSPLATGEDVALVSAMAGRRVIRSAAHPVTTSARSDPRAPDGFGEALRQLAG